MQGFTEFRGYTAPSTRCAVHSCRRWAWEGGHCRQHALEEAAPQPAHQVVSPADATSRHAELRSHRRGLDVSPVRVSTNGSHSSTVNRLVAAWESMARRNRRNVAADRRAAGGCDVGASDVAVAAAAAGAHVRGSDEQERTRRSAVRQAAAASSRRRGRGRGGYPSTDSRRMQHRLAKDGSLVQDGAAAARKLGQKSGSSRRRGAGSTRAVRGRTMPTPRSLIPVVGLSAVRRLTSLWESKAARNVPPAVVPEDDLQRDGRSDVSSVLDLDMDSAPLYSDAAAVASTASWTSSVSMPDGANSPVQPYETIDPFHPLRRSDSFSTAHNSGATNEKTEEESSTAIVSVHDAPALSRSLRRHLNEAVDASAEAESARSGSGAGSAPGTEPEAKGGGEAKEAEEAILSPQDAFTQFIASSDLLAIVAAHQRLTISLGFGKSARSVAFEDLHASLDGALKYKDRALLRHLKEARHCASSVEGARRADPLNAVVVGGGPVGLRSAIELALLGHSVQLVEKRQSFTRYNVLHLWNWVVQDLSALGAKVLVKQFGMGSLLHIGTRDLQCFLLKVALLLGVEIHAGVEFEALTPCDDGTWSVECRSDAGGEIRFANVDAVVGAAGSRDKLVDTVGFERVSERMTRALGLVAHFQNTGTKQERSIPERSVARQFHQRTFKDLAAKGLDLENMVYYRDNSVHYYVMTPSLRCLVDAGVVKDAHVPESELLSRDNIDARARDDFARRAATEFGLLASCPVMPGRGNIGLFDFSSRSHCKEAMKVLRHPSSGTNLLVGLAGDSLLEPFWPEGLGINRGNLSALDTVWAMHCSRFQPLEQVMQVRTETLNAMLSVSAFSTSRLRPDHRSYGVNPTTRYNGITE